MEIVDIIANVLIFAGIGVVGIVFAKRLHIPYTLLLVIFGFLFSLLVNSTGWKTGIRSSSFHDIMLYILLPVLIFEAALGLHNRRLFEYLPNVLTLATLGMLISTVVTAGILYFFLDSSSFPLVAALLTGVVISATDPVAVVTQLKALKAPEDLNTLIEGESLFNDATAIVLFTIVMAVAMGERDPGLLLGLLTFVKVFVGGIVIGGVLGWLAAALLNVMPISISHLTILSLFLAYLSFFLAEHIFQVSGIVAVLFAALIFKKHGKRHIQPEHDTFYHLWESLGFVADIFVFTLLGLVLSIELIIEHWLAISLAIIAALIARAAAVYLSIWVNEVSYGHLVDRKYPPVMIWGGLRGAVTVVLVLSIPADLPYWRTIQAIGFGIVLFTLVVQATTNPALVKRLHIK